MGFLPRGDTGCQVQMQTPNGMSGCLSARGQWKPSRFPKIIVITIKITTALSDFLLCQTPYSCTFSHSQAARCQTTPFYG